MSAGTQESCDRRNAAEVDALHCSPTLRFGLRQQFRARDVLLSCALCAAICAICAVVFCFSARLTACSSVNRISLSRRDWPAIRSACCRSVRASTPGSPAS